MRRLRLFPALLLCLTPASRAAKELPGMELRETDGRSALLWGRGRSYRPFCVVDKRACGQVLGTVSGNPADRVSRYKDLSPEEWLANYLTTDGGAGTRI